MVMNPAAIIPEEKTRFFLVEIPSMISIAHATQARIRRTAPDRTETSELEVVVLVWRTALPMSMIIGESGIF